jgi:glycerol uptake facilitator-like aquaporin
MESQDGRSRLGRTAGVRGSMQVALAEYFGSMTLVVAAISPVILAHDVLGAGLAVSVLMDAVAVGLVLFALIEVLGPISSCHLNPAVTVSMMMAGRIDARRGLLYVVFQLLGGLTGTLVSHLMFLGNREVPFMALSTVVRTDGAYLGEVFGTFTLVLVVHGCARARSSNTGMVVGALVGGLLVTTSSTMFANPQVTVARIFTSSLAGIRPLDALAFIAVQMGSAALATYAAEALFGGDPRRAERPAGAHRLGSLPAADGLLHPGGSAVD